LLPGAATLEQFFHHLQCTFVMSDHIAQE
jgi:hypothetical protein